MIEFVEPLLEDAQGREDPSAPPDSFRNTFYSETGLSDPHVASNFENPWTSDCELQLFAC